MNTEGLVSQLYQIAVQTFWQLKKLDKKKVMHILRIVLQELADQLVSWIVLAGVVIRNFIEVVFLETILWWLTPVSGVIEK